MGEYLIAFIFGGVAGFIISLFIGRSSSANNELVAKLEAELTEVKEKLKQQTEHFAESENMLHKIGSDLKDLYQHMSKNEISTLKEKFKGLVIDADTELDELEHKAEDLVDELKDKAEDLVEAAKDKVEDVKEAVEDKVEEIKEDIADHSEEHKAEVDEAAETIKDTAETAKEKTDEVTDEVKDQINSTIDELAEKDKKKD